MLRIAIQAKGRLNEESIGLLAEAGVSIEDSKRKLLARSDGFPLEVLYLRDDDIPQAVSMGVADLGVVGLNEVEEKGFDVEIVHRLGFGKCPAVAGRPEDGALRRPVVLRRQTRRHVLSGHPVAFFPGERHSGRNP